MFTKIGKKIKILAQVEFYILTISSVVGALYLIFNFGQMLGTGNAILLGLLIILVGVLLAWITSFVLYGFGELVDNSTIIKDALTGGAPSEQPQQKSSPLNGLAKAVSGGRFGRETKPQQPAQPTQGQGAYQPPQTASVPPKNVQNGAYVQQPNPYGRAGSYPPSRQPANLTGNSGWTQVDAQNIQCPNCHYTLPAAQAKVYGCCPQCRMPFRP